MLRPISTKIIFTRKECIQNSLNRKRKWQWRYNKTILAMINTLA